MVCGQQGGAPVPVEGHHHEHQPGQGERKKETPRRVTSGCGMEAIGRKMQKPRPLRDIVRELAHTGKFVTLHYQAFESLFGH